MKRFVYLVNPSLSSFRFAASAVSCEGPNYSKASGGLARASFAITV